MALPLQPAWRETAKRRLPSIHGESPAEDVGGPCCSPPKIKARRLEGLSGDFLWPSMSAATAEAPAANTGSSLLRTRSPLSSPLKRRLQTSVDDENRASPADAPRAPAAGVSAAEATGADLASNSKMLQSPVRLHFPITSGGTAHTTPELPLFPSGASGCVAVATGSGGPPLPTVASQAQCSLHDETPHFQRSSQARGGAAASLALDARSLLTTAAAAAAAAAAAPGSPEGGDGAANRRLHQRPSFLNDPASPFSTSRRRRAPPSAAATAANDAVAIAAGTPSPTRRAPAAAVGGDFARAPDVFIDQKVSPVSSRRRASPYHKGSSSSRGAVEFEEEALSPFRLTPPRKKPQFSFDTGHSDAHKRTVQEQQENQQEQQHQTAACCELCLTPQEIASMQQVFSEQQQRSETFCCSSLDTCAAEEAPISAVRLNRQLERLCRLYGL